MNKVFIFAAGAAIGSIVTWKIVEAKYKKIADEEIESVKEVYRNRYNKETGVSEIAPNKEINKGSEMSKKADVNSNIVSNLGYGNNDSDDDDNYTIQIDELEEGKRLYNIGPEDYGSLVGYDAKSFTYYTDGILTDENDEIVEDPESVIGDGISHIGEHGYPAAWMRNDDEECDYEIIKEDVSYRGTHKDE